MTKRVIVYVACSVDGYLADSKGSVAWLDQYNGVDCKYELFCRDIDAVVMGNTTYKQILTFGAYPYADKKGYVFTRDTTLTSDENVTYIHTLDAFQDLLTHHNSIWIVGGSQLIELVQEYVTDYILTITPDLLGKGMPLFNDQHPQKLILESHVVFDKGLTQLHYRVKSDESK